MMDVVYDRVIIGGRVIDPESGLDAVRNVGLLDGKIAVITTEDIRGRDAVDASGLVVAPGFIDVHSHGTTDETYRLQSLDGVTTTLELELGTDNVDAWYRQHAAGERINYGVSIGHIKVRMAVMGDSSDWFPVDHAAYDLASPAQAREIVQRIETGLSEGAICIGMGIQYTPAAEREELLRVFKVAARTKTPVHVHIVPGSAGLKDVLSLATETNAPLQVVHLNSSALSETPMMLEMIEAARAAGYDVSAEAYPYTAGMTEIQSATIQDIYKSAPDDRLAAIEWPRTGERLNRDSFDQYTRTGGPIVVHSNTEEMVAIAIASPLTMIASDAYWQKGTGHPRTSGTFSRVLGRYVRETQTLTLMEAIHKMTLKPAQRLEARVPAMRNKGRLRVGADADITIFDAATVLDRATYREPSLSPVGIQHVMVNGVAVVADGRAVEGVAPGKPVRAVCSLGLASKTVTVVPYHRDWPTLFTQEVARLEPILAAHGVTLVLEHTGSTAVPGLAAKPVLDILAGRRSDENRAAEIAALEEAGYVYRGESGIPGRDFFRRGDPRQYHIHLANIDSDFWRDHLAFRDYLRAHPDALADYAALKLNLAARYPRDREAYIEAKAPFVESVLLKARQSPNRI